MRLKEVVFRMSLHFILLLLTSFYNVLAQVYQRTDQSLAMAKWPSEGGYPTWHFDTDMSEKPLTQWEELDAIANAHWGTGLYSNTALVTAVAFAWSHHCGIR